MSSTPPSPPSEDYVIPARYWSWLGTRRALAALIWVVALGYGAGLLYHSLHWFDNRPSHSPERHRADGNNGHTQIDFGGQWVMGRMLATGRGRQLYHRQKQWEVVREGFRIEDEAPIQREDAPLPRSLQKLSRPDEDWQHDATNLMNWFMGGENDAKKEWKQVAGASVAPLAQPPTGHPLMAVALEKAAADTITPELVAKVNEPSIGGPLYPPVHAVFYAPLGMIDRPQRAYHLLQVLFALLTPIVALGVKVLTRGRIWWSAATLAILLYPGMRGGLDLGQNPILSLGIVVWGWALASRGYNVAGGMVWGLFAFKPVWALAFLLVPLLMRRWRFFFAMSLTGAGFVALTLPFVGIDTWFDWLKVGNEAAELYKVNDNWIHLSRDLQGVPRRILIDFAKPEAERNTPLVNALAWGLWAAVLGATVLVYALRADRSRATGIGAGFLFLGAYLSCFHFMYYDVLISLAALAVLLADRKQFINSKPFALEPAAAEARIPPDRALPLPAPTPKPLAARLLGYVNSFPLTIVVALFLVENSLNGLELEATLGIRSLATPATDGSTNVHVPRMHGAISVKYPTDTFLLMALWLWCGWRLLRGDERKGQFLGPAVPAEEKTPGTAGPTSL